MPFFEYDDNKSHTNLLKHKVDFEEAILVFNDPNRYEKYDGRHENEDRWITIGLTEDDLLVVVYTIRGLNSEVIRLISARKGLKNDYRKYRTNFA